MGRNIFENLNKKKIIYNQYAGSQQSFRGAPLQYTCPAGKSAKINFGYSSTVRNGSCGVSQFKMSLFVTKKTTGIKFHSVIAAGNATASQQEQGQMLSLRPWWNFNEGAQNTAVSTGSQNYQWMGIDSSKYMRYTFDGNNNDVTTNPSDFVWHSQGINNPYNSGSLCDAHKDYVIHGGNQVYFNHSVETNGSPLSNSNQVDIMFEVEEMEAFA